VNQETYTNQDHVPEHVSDVPETQALVRPSIGYTSEAFVTEKGLGVSRETTTWRDVPARGEDEAILLEEAARRAAIAYAVAWAQPDDVVLVAGKGHESGQTSGGQTRPFDDRDELTRALEAQMTWGARP